MKKLIPVALIIASASACHFSELQYEDATEREVVSGGDLLADAAPGERVKLHIEPDVIFFFEYGIQLGRFDVVYPDNTEYTMLSLLGYQEQQNGIDFREYEDGFIVRELREVTKARDGCLCYPCPDGITCYGPAHCKD